MGFMGCIWKCKKNSAVIEKYEADSAFSQILVKINLLNDAFCGYFLYFSNNPLSSDFSLMSYFLQCHATAAL